MQVSSETKSADVTIAPWGSIAGRVMQGSKPLANAHALHLRRTRALRPHHRHATKTIPNRCRRQFLGLRSRPRRDQARGAERSRDAAATPAGPTPSSMPGRPPPSTSAAPAGPSSASSSPNPRRLPTTQPLVWDYKSKKFSPNRGSCATPAPLAARHQASSVGETLEEYRAIEEAFGRTPRGKRAKEWKRSARIFAVNPDGSFRIDDVPRRRLRPRIARQSSWPRCRHQTTPKTSARTQSNLHRRSHPGDRSDDPQDIGSVEMKLTPYLRSPATKQRHSNSPPPMA